MPGTPQLLPLRAIWLLVPPILLCTLDAGFTLYGQSPNYWAGNYADVNELSPSFAHALSIHPLAFVGLILLWIVLFSATILLLPELLALTISVAIVIGHVAGAGGWLLYHFENYQACIALVLVSAFVIVLSFKRGQCESGQSAFDWQRTGLPGWSRWALVALLIALPVWWLLIPH